MLSPNFAIQEALYTALSTANLNLNGIAVPVFAYALQGAAMPYVLLDQVSTVPTTSSTSCKIWRSIVQVTVLTSFENVGWSDTRNFGGLPNAIVLGKANAKGLILRPEVSQYPKIYNT